MTYNTLSNDDVEQFKTDGYCILKNAMPRDNALAIQDYIWSKLDEYWGCKKDDPSTWTRSYRHIQETYNHGPFETGYTDRVCGALNDLLGKDCWEHPPGMGWWPVTFPSAEETEWTVPTEGWHVDGSNFHHHIYSRDQGMLLIFVFSDIGPGDGGTAIVPGSHITTAKILAAAEPDGLKPKEVSRPVIEATDFSKAIEVNAQAGDALLAHPFMLHSPSVNVGDHARFICNVQVQLKEHMSLNPDVTQHTVLEDSILQAIA
jgi:hypothetical protein